MATIHYTAKVRESRLIELPESAAELGLTPGDEISVRLDHVHIGNISAKHVPTSPQVRGLNKEPDYLREEYRELVVKKIHNKLTAPECAQLEVVRDQLNDLDRQSESWSKMERHASQIEQELSDIRRELESFPDA